MRNISIQLPHTVLAHILPAKWKQRQTLLSGSLSFSHIRIQLQVLIGASVALHSIRKHQTEPYWHCCLNCDLSPALPGIRTNCSRPVLAAGCSSIGPSPLQLPDRQPPQFSTAINSRRAHLDLQTSRTPNNHPDNPATRSSFHQPRPFGGVTTNPIKSLLCPKRLTICDPEPRKWWSLPRASVTFSRSQ